MTTQLKTSLALFLLGLTGIISLVFSPLPIKIPDEILAKYSPSTLSLLMMVQPAILLFIAVIIGKNLAPKVNLSAPLIKGFFDGKFDHAVFKEQLKIGSFLGFGMGLLLAFAAYLSTSFLPEELTSLNASTGISPIARFLYGGITEEVLVRWGFMSLFVWACWKLFGKRTSEPTPAIYWAGIFLAAFLFGIGHLPAVYGMVENVTPLVICYIIIANMAFGIVAGWLFWKKGLEAAIIAHVFAHVGMMVVEKTLM